MKQKKVTPPMFVFFENGRGVNPWPFFREMAAQHFFSFLVLEVPWGYPLLLAFFSWGLVQLGGGGQRGEGKAGGSLNCVLFSISFLM